MGFERSWHYGFIAHGNEAAVLFPRLNDGRAMLGVQIYVRPETIGQFTGLHDKDGKEIYEGDICRMECGKRFAYMEVAWHEKDAHFGFRLSGENYVGCSDAFSDWIRQKRVEVIGNIHDNPELMKGGQNG